MAPPGCWGIRRIQGDDKYEVLNARPLEAGNKQRLYNEPWTPYNLTKASQFLPHTAQARVEAEPKTSLCPQEKMLSARAPVSNG